MVDVTRIFDVDPTLEAADREMVRLAKLEKPRPYLGMSSIGEACSRKLWFRFRWALRETFDAVTLKRFEDGHRTEDLVVSRLSKVIKVWGQQEGFTDIDSHFKGHVDGYCNPLQAVKTDHVLEIKCTAKLSDIKKAKLTYGEKAALKAWNPQYYAQAILYMFYKGFKRHYLVAASPGGREEVSIRTDENDDMAKSLRSKAERIIKSNTPPEAISDDPAWFACRSCTFAGLCHQNALPDRNCRTCSHSETGPNGTWHCTLFKEVLSLDKQAAGCPSHVHIPALVKAEIIASTATSVTYRMKNGEVWTDGKP